MRVQELRILYVALAVVVVVVGWFIYNELTQTSEDKYVREMTDLSENVKSLLGDYKQETEKVLGDLGIDLAALAGDTDLPAADYAKIDERLQGFATNVGNNINDLAELASKWKFREEVPEKFQVRHDNWIESIELIADWLITYGRIGTYRDPRTRNYRTAPDPDFLRTIHRREIEGFISYLKAQTE